MYKEMIGLSVGSIILIVIAFLFHEFNIFDNGLLVLLGVAVVLNARIIIRLNKIKNTTNEDV